MDEEGWRTDKQNYSVLVLEYPHCTGRTLVAMSWQCCLTNSEDDG